MQTTITDCPVLPAMEPRAAWSENNTEVLMQGAAMQETGLNRPLVKHVVTPPPLKPGLQVTVTVVPVDPKMEPGMARSEFATSVRVQLLAAQVTALNNPLGKHVAVPLPL